MALITHLLLLPCLLLQVELLTFTLELLKESLLLLTLLLDKPLLLQLVDERQRNSVTVLLLDVFHCSIAFSVAAPSFSPC